MSNNDLATTATRNRSIRTILTELEFLAEARIITQDDYNKITVLLPETKTYSGAAFTVPQPTPVANDAPIKAKTPAVSQVASQLASTFNSEKKQPFQQPAPETTAPPPSYASLSDPAVPFTARALHDYGHTADWQPGDLKFLQGGLIRVHKKDSADWWSGRLLDEHKQPIGEIGLFPKTYVKVELDEKVGDSKPALPMRRTGDNMMMNIAHDNGQGSGSSEDKGKSKLEENGTKFGKKLGNAAIFGAGATIGSKIVSGIF